jgi:TMEM175 potassium channel family protein
VRNRVIVEFFSVTEDVAASGEGEYDRSDDLDRVVFFSDAVFAIAMTVLALSLKLPARTTDAGVAHALQDALPSIYTYVLSFAVVGLYWLAHHRMFRYITRFDSVLLALNLATLGTVAFTPFPTSVLGDHGNTTAAVVFYAATMSVLGGLVTVLWAYASRGYRLIAPTTPHAFIRHTLWRGAAVPVVFLGSIPIAFASPNAAEWFWLLIVVIRIVLRRRYGSVLERDTRS